MRTGTIEIGNVIVGPIKAVETPLVVQLSGAFAGATVALRQNIDGAMVAVPGAAWTEAGRFTVDTSGWSAPLGDKGHEFDLIGSDIDASGTTSVLAVLGA